MAATSLLSLSFFSQSVLSSSNSTSINNVRTRTTSKPSRISIAHCSAAASSTEAGVAKPQIELEFIGNKVREDGNYPVERTSVISGEKVLRNIMIENKIELYGPYGKVMNCGGGGSCGTCIVEIINGKDLLSERTRAEDRYLKKKPESWRLACQTIVGNKENAGKIVVQQLPQWKK